MISFWADRAAYKQQCYAVSLGIEQSGASLEKSFFVEETAAYYGFQFVGERAVFHEVNDRRSDCEGGGSGRSSERLERNARLNGPTTISFDIRHGWTWIGEGLVPEQVDAILSLLVSLSPAQQEAVLKLVFEKAFVDDLLAMAANPTATFVFKLAGAGAEILGILDKALAIYGSTPVAIYGYALDAGRMDIEVAAPANRTVQTIVGVPNWAIVALAGHIASTFLCKAGPVWCVLGIGLSKGLHNIAVDPDSDYSQTVDAQPIEVSELAELPAGSERDCLEGITEILAALRAAETAAIRAAGAWEAGDRLWYARQALDARRFMIAATLGQLRLDACSDPEMANQSALSPTMRAVLQQAGVEDKLLAVFDRQAEESSLDQALAADPVFVSTLVGQLFDRLADLGQRFAVLYSANWTVDMNGWEGPPDWKVRGGLLISDGTNADTRAWLAPPFTLGGLEDYAVEVEARLPETAVDCDDGRTFGIVAHPSGGGRGYRVSFAVCRNLLGLPDATAQFDFDTEWRTVRVDVRGQSVRVLVDGQSILETQAQWRESSGVIGLFSEGAALEVRRFEVLALPPAS